MKLRAIQKKQQTEEEPVRISIEQDDDDVNVYANDALIMWISNGEIYIADDDDHQLQRLGFTIDESTHGVFVHK